MATRACRAYGRWCRRWMLVGLLLLLLMLLLLLLVLLVLLVLVLLLLKLLLVLLGEMLSLRDGFTLRQLHFRSLRRRLVLHGIVGDCERRVRGQRGRTVETAEEILCHGGVW